MNSQTILFDFEELALERAKCLKTLASPSVSALKRHEADLRAQVLELFLGVPTRVCHGQECVQISSEQEGYVRLYFATVQERFDALVKQVSFAQVPKLDALYAEYLGDLRAQL